MSNSKVIGTPTPLLDGQAKITGALRYAPDLNLPGMLHARLVVSIHAHADILGIDCQQALAVPGVVAVLTAHDLPDIAPTHRARLLLARGRVIFAGQPVALVVATSEAAAEDGVEQVSVDYQPLPAAVNFEQALAENAPLVWPQGAPDAHDKAKPSNVILGSAFRRGDVEAGFAEADVIIERTVVTPMVHQSAIETQSMIVQPDPVTGGATVWSSTQAPFDQRLELAEILDVPESDVRVIATPVGGGFGGKYTLYEPLIALAARKLGRTVRLVLTRLEEMSATNPAPAMRVHARLGAKRDGSLTALEATVYVDNGCFDSWLGWGAGAILGSQYRIPNMLIQPIGVLTFKQSVGAYRGPTGPTVIFAIDCLIDQIAARLSLDPLEIRRQNAILGGDLLADGTTAGNSGAREVLAALEQHPLWQNRKQSRAAGRGVGMGMVLWTVSVDSANASCTVNRDGKLQINVGSVDISGTTTSFALMAAETFGVPVEDVRVISGDTANAPFSGMTGGSKITYTTGAAVVKAAQEARRQVLEIASDEFEAAVEDLEIVDGKVQVRGVPSKAISLGSMVARTMVLGTKHAPVLAQGRFAGVQAAPCFNAQLVEVEVDRETGEVRIVRLVVIQDVGRAINPLAVHGQLMGGATQGVGWALYEKMSYDDNGQLLSGSFMDYAIPSATQTAHTIETILVEVPSDFGPFGIRGVGEPPIIPTAAAVANAIAHATGVRLSELPMTPPQVLAALIRSDKAAPNAS